MTAQIPIDYSSRLQREGAVIDLPMFFPIPRPPADTPANDGPDAATHALQQVRSTVSSVLGSLRGGAYQPESGLHWAAGYLTRGEESQLVLTNSDAGWLPHGVQVPQGVRVLWNVPEAVQWATIDDPVRQLLEFAKANDYTVGGVATTHPSRASHIPHGPWELVGEKHAGPVRRESASRLDVVASTTRAEEVRGKGADAADKQCRALIADLERIEFSPAHAVGDLDKRTKAGHFLRAGREVPIALLTSLHRDDEALGDALREERVSPWSLNRDGPPPDSEYFRACLIERAVVSTTLAAAYHDIESAVYNWTFARYLAS